ncbi:MAG: hypothetical protein K9G62_06365 [Alphaproteobacteria bacterium]|nr:hypothetical protein [Alphaproteobacteria bacterium]
MGTEIDKIRLSFDAQKKNPESVAEGLDRIARLMESIRAGNKIEHTDKSPSGLCEIRPGGSLF